MPMLLYGNGTISGATSLAGSVSIAGTANVSQGLTTASRGIDNASLPAGAVLQIVNFQTGAVATGTTQIPRDDTIPQNTEGDEYMSLSITPKSATSKLKIDVVCEATCSIVGSFTMTIALFQDSTANALATQFQAIASQSYPTLFTFSHFMTSGTTSSTTFKVRAGSNAAGTTTFNGFGGARYYGGTIASSITITEIAT